VYPLYKSSLNLVVGSQHKASSSSRNFE